MAPSKARSRLKTSQPDGEDVLAAMDAIKKDFNADAELHIYVSLDGRLFVEGIAYHFDVEGKPATASIGRFAGGYGYPVTTVLMQVSHLLYQLLDREHLKRLRGLTGAT